MGAAHVMLEQLKTTSGRRFPALGKSNRVAVCARSWQFSAVVALAICLNAVTIGLQTNFLVGQAFADSFGRPSHAMTIPVPTWISQCFAVLFTLECLWRASIERSNFLFGHQWRWNVFDSFLMIANLIEVAAETSSLAYARVLRLLRIVHVLQVLRVLRVFDVLRHMVYAILNSMLSLLWVVLVLALMIYVYGVFLISVVGEHVQGLDSRTASEDYIHVLDKLFGTLSRTMLSIFEGVTGGRNYYELLEPLKRIHWVYAVAFLFFYIFIVFGVLNIVTGIFVESATELTKLDKEMTVMNQLDDMNRFVREIKAFFRKADADNNGLISWEEFRDQLRDSKVRGYFMTMGIDVQSAGRVFQMLDHKGHGTVDVKDFVEGCIRLKGVAKSIDMCMLLNDVRRMSGMLEDKFSALQATLGVGKHLSIDLQEGLSEHAASSVGTEGFRPMACDFEYSVVSKKEVLPPLRAGNDSPALAGTKLPATALL